ncbi:MAG: ABC transporter ATP-binding protein [Treponema sp.]|jgi:simple sugar transport system ATP-binding protein|nr:ABC transporter ATP-binding protein [Treponema sp.]
MEHITKQFGSVYANRDITFSVAEGEVHTLLGENGAGKSTLMNILSGLYQPSDGAIIFNGKKVRIDSPARAVEYGIGMVHQHFMLVEAMTVFENIILGLHRSEPAKNKHSIFIKKDTLKKEILSLAEKYGLELDLDKDISEISVGEQQRVEILKVLYRGARLLILDEPTAVLTDTEARGLFKIIRHLTEEHKSVIFISHKMREVLSISDRITILREGQTVGTVLKNETSADELAQLMMGHKLADQTYIKEEKRKDALLEFKHVDYNHLSRHSGLSDICLSVSSGEIVGIAGVDGNGQSQLAQIAAGILKPDGGTINLQKNTVQSFTPSFFIDRHVALIPEDRGRMGLVGAMTIEENLILKDPGNSSFSWGNGFFLNWKKIDRYAEQLKEKYDIRCENINQEVRNLSGGNQQKVILARELDANPDVLIAVHPTRGLDIGAAEYIHDKIIQERDRGCGVLLISADFDEILKLSTRIAVMFEGNIVGIYPGNNPPLEEISLAMSGKCALPQNHVPHGDSYETDAG